MTASKCLTALACAFATAEAIALLGVSLGLWWAPRASLLSRIAWWRRKPAEEPALPPAAQPPAEPAAGAGAPAELPAAEPSAKSSTTTQRPSSGLELAAGGALGAHALECLPSEVGAARPAVGRLGCTAPLP